VKSLEWDPGGRWIASSTDGGEVLIFDVHTGTMVRAWKREVYMVGPFVAFLEGESALVVGQSNGLIEVLDLSTGRSRQRAVVECGAIQMKVSPDRRRLVATHYDGRFTVFSLPELTPLHVSERVHNYPPGFLAFSADGRLLVTGAYGNAAVLWATDSWQPVLSLPETMSSFSAWINPLAFLADSSSLVVGHRIQGVDGWAIWDLSQIWPKLDELGLGREASGAGRTRRSGPVGRIAAVTERVMIPANLPPGICVHFVRHCLELEPDQAQACTDMAWQLATIADPKLRDPEKALPWARNAVRLAPGSPLCWNTLGAAHYRLGHYQEAIAALQKSIQLNADVATAHDALFLAMSHHRLGRPDQARVWFDRALQARQEFTSNDPRRIEELDRIQAEAEGLLTPETQP
jgi:hypothetical protein